MCSTTIIQDSKIQVQYSQLEQKFEKGQFSLSGEIQFTVLTSESPILLRQGDLSYAKAAGSVSALV